MSDRDRARLDWLESQKSGRGWNVGVRTEGWPLQVVTRGPFNSLRDAIDHAMDVDADRKAEEAR